MSDSFFDVIIIGAGPIGLSCGIEAVRRNLSYLILEKGCLVNSIFNYPTNMTFFSTSDRLEIGDVPFVSHGDKPTRREALEYYRRVKQSWNLDVHTFETVNEISKDNGIFQIISDKSNYFCKNVIIATGFFDKPNYLNIPGEDLLKVKHYFNEAHPYSYLDIVVVGAANSAVDVALETYRRGSNVTMVIREDRIKDNVKYWVKPDIDNRIKEGAIKAYFNSELSIIQNNYVEIKTLSGIIQLKNDFVFAMTGYHSDYNFLTNAGIEIHKDINRTPVFNEETFETNIKSLFIAGVVCGGMDNGKWFIENSRFHAQNIFNFLITN